MKNHTKVYLQAFGYDTNSWIACEVCGGTANSVHHIIPRGMGGSKRRDTIENLMALCQSCHHEADFGEKLSGEYLTEVHKLKMQKL